FTLGVFLKPLGAELHWSRAEISLAFTLCTVMTCITIPLVGGLVDRHGARRVAVPSLLLFGILVASLYFLTASLWHLYAVFLLIGLVASGCTPLPYARVISEWFDKRRGLALGFTMAGVGVGTFVMPSLAQALVSTNGWRAAYACLGMLVIVIAAPTVRLLLRETPAMMGLQPDGESASAARVAKTRSQTAGLDCRDARRTAGFWCVAVAFFLVSVATNGCVVHLVPLLTDRGVSAQGAAFAASVAGGAVLVGRVWTGYLLDRFFAPTVTIGFFLALALGVFLLWTGATETTALFAAMLVGLGLGAEVDIIAFLVGRYFGLRAFGEIYGYLFASFVLGAGVGPLIMGSGFDATGSYRWVLGAFALITLVASGLMTQLGSYRYEAGVPKA
ncbi:MAG: MFS transporter, partial [Gammaproteobacteria bacterium]